MPANVESMYYAGAVPWHGIGVGVEEAKTGAAAIKLAGLDWEVAMGPVYAGGPDKKSSREVDGRYSIYRVSDGVVYATHASDRYIPWQNFQAIEWMDSLLEDGSLRYEAMGSLREGRRCWALARLEEGMTVADDEFFQYMLVTWGHDLFGSIQALPTNVRAICENTLTAALGQGANRRVKISHMPGMDEKLAEAQRAFRITTETNRRMAEWLDTLSTVKLSETRSQAIVDGIFGERDEANGRKAASIDRFTKILDAEVEHSGRTGYAMVNAITGYADHMLSYNGDTDQRAESRMLSVIEGASEKFKERGLAVFAEHEPKAVLTFSAS